jgi:multimeric flavodoxin WrbA
MKIIGIVGSKRKKGNTAVLIEEALHAVRSEGIETEIVYLGDYDIKGCTGCEGCRETYTCVMQDGMQELYPKVMEADGLIAGSPTYFYNMTAEMKAFIERLYCYEVFDESDRSVWMSVNEAMGGKLAVTISICEQHDVKDMGITSEAMDLSLVSLGYRIVDSVKVLELYEAGAAKQCPKALEQSRHAGRKLARTLLLRQKIRKKNI